MTQTQAYVQKTRDEALDNFFFFTRACLGQNKLTDRFHKDMCDELQYVDALRRLWLAPRDHYKSTIVGIAFPLWLLIRDPEERILIAADTANNAEKKLAKIKQLILGSKGIRAFFPEIIPRNVRKTTWSDSEIILPREEAHAEPSISTVGAGGAVVGQHFTRIICDDIIAKEASDSPSVMASVVRWADNLESLLVEPYVHTIDVVGTRWTHDDVYEHLRAHWKDGEDLEDRPFYREFIRSFWTSPGEPLFPELYGGKKNALDYARRQQKQNAYLWSCHYENDPRSPEAEFQIEDLQSYQWDASKEHVLFEEKDQTRVIGLAAMTVYMTIDPAYAKERGSSMGAIIVSGCIPSGEIFILEAIKDRWGGQGLIKAVKRMSRKYQAYLRTVGVEATGTQQAWIDDLMKEMRHDGLYVRIESLQPGGKAGKDARIRFQLQKYFGAKRVYITSEMNQLQRELRHFPLSKEKDLLDAAAYSAEHYWNRVVPINKESNDRELASVAAREATRNSRTGY